MKEFTKDICDRFSNILLEFQSDDNLSIYHTKNTIDVNGDEGRVYIKLFRDEIQIPYIVLKNKRKGTGTAVINECINICKEMNLKRVTILGVMTEEMKCLCNKLGFSKIEYNYYDNNDYEFVL